MEAIKARKLHLENALKCSHKLLKGVGPFKKVWYNKCFAERLNQTEYSKAFWEINEIKSMSGGKVLSDG